MDLDAQLELALWWQNLRATTNAIFFPLYFDENRYLVLKGGGGSGKSIFAGRKLLERATTEKGHRFLVCRKVAKTLRESCFKQLIGQLQENYPGVDFKANKSDLVISIPSTGSEIIFAGLDDVEKLKSIYNLTGIWIEEASELLESDFNQLDIRLRGETPYYQQIILSFNPIHILHWLKLHFFDQTLENATCSQSTYKDNRFLPEESKKVLEAFQTTDAYYYTVYCLGEWGVTGESVFNAEAVTKRLLSLPEPLRQGRFEYDDDGLKITNIRFVEDRGGPISVYKEPEPGRPYVIGGDPAGDGSDRFVLQCIDNITMEQAATFRRTKIDEDQFAHQAYCLGITYNTALIGIETNWSTYPVLELERLRYPKQYVREAIDDYTHAVKRAFGFRTDSKTRPAMIAGLIKAAREDITTFIDRTTLEEMLTFVRNESMRPQAEEGAHDDCIMALAIAYYIRNQQRFYIEQPESAAIEWTDDMREDYNRASATERRLMRKKWGKPK